MTKTEALRMLGGNAATAALAIGCTPQAIRQWPNVLTRRIEDRVIAARWRLDQALRQQASLEKKRDWARVQEIQRRKRLRETAKP